MKYTGCIVNDEIGYVIGFGDTYGDECNTWYVFICINK